MRQPAPDSRPVALTIAGSDSGGGAGIQADLATFGATGVYGTSVITAVTAQHTRGVESAHVLPPAEVEAQLAAVTDDFDLKAVKTGMLATAELVEMVAKEARRLEVPLVVDPVMVATSGDRLLEPAAEAAYEDLIGEATVVTPNADEAAVLTGIAVEGKRSAREAGEALLEWGADAALIKGGHVPGETVADVLVTPDGGRSFTHPRVDTEATHGSGCTLGAAIAGQLATGSGLETAVDRATELLARAVRYHYDVGQGPGAVNHLVGLRNEAAREPTAEAVADVVDRFVEADVSPLVPEVGMNVVGATPFAERPEEAAAVEGRITRTFTGVHPNRGVRFGASSHVARFLLSARESRPELRFAVNCRFNAEIEAAIESLGWPVGEYDREAEPESPDAPTSGTMGWGATQAFSAADGERPPVAVLDRGAVGKEAITKIVAPDGETVCELVLELCEAVRE